VAINPVIPELLPSPSGLIEQSPAADLDGASATVKSCQETLNSVTAEIQADITACLGACGGVLEICRQCILGDIERDISKAASVLEKCGDKVLNQLRASIADMLAKAAVVGIQPPTEEQFAAALAGQPIPDVIELEKSDRDGKGAAKPAPPPPVVPPLPPGLELPPGAVFPIADMQTGALTCPPPGRPYPNASSPTGWLQDFWVPVRGEGGAILWCVRQTEIAVAPIPPIGGGTPPVTGQPSAPSAGNDTLLGGQGLGTGQPTNGNGVTGNGTCPPGYRLSQNAAESLIAGAFSIPGVGICVPNSGSSDPSQPQPPAQCPPGCQPTASQPPASTGSPPEVAKASSFCRPDDWRTIGNNITDSFLTTVDKEQRFSDLLGTDKPPSSGPFINSLLSGIGLSPTSVISTFFDAVATGVATVYDVFIAPRVIDTGCTQPAFVKSTLTEALYSFLDRWFGLVPSSLALTQRYTTNYLCQYIIPTGPELNATVTRGYISHGEWDMGIKANGLCVPWQERIRDASYQRIGIRDAYRLWKLDKLTDDEFKQAWERSAVDWQHDETKYKDAQLQYPPFSDLIRMMQRDVADEQVVTDLELDTDFTNKWDGSLKQWGEAQGISDEIAKFYWRAHWQQASPTQIFTWLHRLRPDDRNNNDPFASITFTVDQAKDLLRIADYVPANIDRYIATSYRPMGRVDIRRGYEVGSIDTLDEVRQRYRDLGYDSDVAERLTKFTEIDSRPKRAKRDGALPATEVLRAFTAGLIGENETRQLLDQSGFTASQIDRSIQSATIRAAIADRKLRADAVRRRYFMGELSDSELGPELDRNGIPAPSQGRFLATWSAQKLARQKEPTIAMLCAWYDKGIIDLPEYQRRVRNLNYSETDALRVIEQCTIGIKERKEKQLQAALLKQEKEAERQLKEQQRAAREVARAARAAKRLIRDTHILQTKRAKSGEIVQTRTDVHTEEPDVNLENITRQIVETQIQPPPG